MQNWRLGRNVGPGRPKFEPTFYPSNEIWFIKKTKKRKSRRKKSLGNWLQARLTGKKKHWTKISQDASFHGKDAKKNAKSIFSHGIISPDSGSSIGSFPPQQMLHVECIDLSSKNEVVLSQSACTMHFMSKTHPQRAVDYTNKLVLGNGKSLPTACVHISTVTLFHPTRWRSGWWPAT